MTPDEAQLQTRHNGDLASAFLNHHAPDDWFRTDDGDFYSVHPDKAELLTQALLSFHAEVIASILNAGSERECVLEDEKLEGAIRESVQSWVDNR